MSYYILAGAVAWLWACTALLGAWLDEETDPEYSFDWKSPDDWVQALLTPIQVTWAIVSGVLIGLFGRDDR